MRQIHIRLTDDLGELLRVYADDRGISLAAAVAVILHEKLSAPA